MGRGRNASGPARAAGATKSPRKGSGQGPGQAGTGPRTAQGSGRGDRGGRRRPCGAPGGAIRGGRPAGEEPRRRPRGRPGARRPRRGARRRRCRARPRHRLGHRLPPLLTPPGARRAARSAAARRHSVPVRADPDGWRRPRSSSSTCPTMPPSTSPSAICTLGIRWLGPLHRARQCAAAPDRARARRDPGGGRCRPLPRRHPAWLAARWSRPTGLRKPRAIATPLARRRLDLTVRASRAWSETLEATRCRPARCAPRPAAAGRHLPGYAEGAWWVQDAAAALPVRLLGGPGSVSSISARRRAARRRSSRRGADRHGDRPLGRRLERLVRQPRAPLPDGRDVAADAVSWRRSRSMRSCSTRPAPRPARSAATPTSPDQARADVSGCAAIQERLLDAAAEMLRPGGVLVYCTCSLEPRRVRRRSRS